jgi:hypothetical protein
MKFVLPQRSAQKLLLDRERFDAKAHLMRQADYWQAGGSRPNCGGDAMSFFSGSRYLSVFALGAVALLFSEDGAVGQQRARQAAPAAVPALDRSVRDNVERLLAEGMQIFRYDTFGSEDFWGGEVKLHQAIEGEKFGGVGPGVSPKRALELGLKVDMEAVPKNVATAIKAGKVDRRSTTPSYRASDAVSMAGPIVT